MDAQDSKKLVDGVRALLAARALRDPAFRDTLALVERMIHDAVSGEDSVALAVASASVSASVSGFAPGHDAIALPTADAAAVNPNGVQAHHANGASHTSHENLAPTSPAKPAPALGLPRPASALVPIVLGGEKRFIRVEGSSDDIARARLGGVASQTPGGAGGVGPASASSRDAAPPPADEQAHMALIARRCELKRASCELLIRQNTVLSAELHGIKGEIFAALDTARATPNCFLWMFMPGYPVPDNDTLRVIAGCYANLAACTLLVARLLQERGAGAIVWTRAMCAFAHAQSALRASLKKTWMERDDFDQFDAFLWLRRTAEREQIYVDRHMRIDDPADPRVWEATRDEIAAIFAGVESLAKRSKEARKALNKARYHAGRITEDGVHSSESDWSALQTAVNQAVAHEPESKADARVIVEGIALHTPTDFETVGAFAELLHRARAGTAHAASDATESQEENEASTPDVLACRAWLRGSHAVIFGGIRVEHQARRITEAFGLEELTWVSLREHASSMPLEAPIRRPQTAVVIALVKLAGHQHIDDARGYAKAAGKPYVLVDSGHNPSQIARAMMNQCADAMALPVATGK